MTLLSVADEPEFQKLSAETREAIRKAEAIGRQEIQQFLDSMPSEVAEALAWLTTLPSRFIRNQLSLYRQLDEYDELAQRWLGLMQQSKTAN